MSIVDRAAWQAPAEAAAAGNRMASLRPERLLRPDFLRALARCWIAIAAVAYLIDLWGQTRLSWTNGGGRPLGDDFLNYWTGAVLAWRHSAADVYAWQAYHAFQERVVGAALDFYHYSYPPVLLVLTAPLAALPYVPALVGWLAASWYAFYRALRAAWPGRGGALILSLATPAVFVNAVGGQNGAWTAALLGGGLAVLDRQPVVAGVLFGLMSYKPHLGVLLPIALVAGRRWRAFAAAAMTVAGLLGLSAVLFGLDIWSAYTRNVVVLRHAILEDGTGVWHRMVSIFVFARRLGVEVGAAYAIQAACGVIAAGFIAWAWYRDVAARARNALLVLGTCLATPYLQDYDLVIGAFVTVWLMEMGASGSKEAAKLATVGAGLVLVVPLVAAPLAKGTNLALGAVGLVAAFGISTWLGLLAQTTGSAGEEHAR